MTKKQEAPKIYESPIEFRNWENMVQSKYGSIFCFMQQKRKKKRRLLIIIILSVYCTSIKYQHRIPFCIFAFKVSCGLSKVYLYIYIYGCGKVGRSDVFPFQNQKFSLLKFNCAASISYINQLHMIYIHIHTKCKWGPS